MEDWIDCGLTWDNDEILIDEFEGNNFPPNLDKEALKKFGKTSASVEDEITKFCEDNKIDRYILSAEENKIIKEISVDSEYKKELKRLGVEDYLSLIDKKLEENIENCEDLILKGLYKLDKQQTEISEWESNHPKTLRYYHKLEKYREKNLQATFCNLGLNKPGVLIEVELENKIKKYLIGHINNIGGGCDHCSGISKSAIIKRYRKVWEENNG